MALIVDDHVAMAESLAEMVDRQGDMRVVEQVVSLAETFEVLAGASPDVVLLDVHLPDGRGVSSVVDVHVACPDADVVLLTAATGLDVIARAVESVRRACCRRLGSADLSATVGAARATRAQPGK